jgi:hypothetical protein
MSLSVVEAARLVGLVPPDEEELRAYLVELVEGAFAEQGEEQFFRQNGMFREMWRLWVDPAAEFADELPKER